MPNNKRLRVNNDIVETKIYHYGNAVMRGDILEAERIERELISWDVVIESFHPTSDGCYFDWYRLNGPNSI